MIRSPLIAVIVVAFATPTAAHVTLETQEAKVGEPYKAVLRVPHGCEGTATAALRVRIPDGVIAVKPMPKPGWTLATTTGKYSKTYTFFHNAKLTEGVTEISWSGGKLPDAWYDEFVFQGSSPAISNPARPSTFRSCRNARREYTAGSRFPRPENRRRTTRSRRQA